MKKNYMERTIKAAPYPFVHEWSEPFSYQGRGSGGLKFEIFGVRTSLKGNYRYLITRWRILPGRKFKQKSLKVYQHDQKTNRCFTSIVSSSS